MGWLREFFFGPSYDEVMQSYDEALEERDRIVRQKAFDDAEKALDRVYERMNQQQGEDVITIAIFGPSGEIAATLACDPDNSEYTAIVAGGYDAVADTSDFRIVRAPEKPKPSLNLSMLGKEPNDERCGG